MLTAKINYKYALYLIVVISFSAFGKLPKYLSYDDLPICPKNIDGWCKIHVDDIHPTQAVEGEDLVKGKHKRYKDADLPKLREVKTTLFVLGPQSKIYIIDRHHFASAVLHSELPYKYRFIVGQITRDWSRQTPEDFWQLMEKYRFTYLKDANFNKITPDQLPSHLGRLEDMPLRTIVTLIFKDPSCEIEKLGIPFEEFYYAEFLYRRGLVVEKPYNTQKVVKDALNLLRDELGRNFRKTLTSGICTEYLNGPP